MFNYYYFVYLGLINSKLDVLSTGIKIIMVSRSYGSSAYRETDSDFVIVVSRRYTIFVGAHATYYTIY